MMGFLQDLLTQWRNGNQDRAGITEVFLAALGTEGRSGYQCELGFGDCTTKSFQAETMFEAIRLAHQWARVTYG